MVLNVAIIMENELYHHKNYINEKKSLISDGQQFHHYQQHKLSTLTSDHGT